MFIRYDDSKILVKLNDQEIVNADIGEFKDKAPDHPGVL